MSSEADAPREITQEGQKEKVSQETEKLAAMRAMARARNARWDLDIAVFLFAVLIVVIILLFQHVGVEIVAPIALFGLVMVWLVGWRRGRRLYELFYEEELSRMEKAREKKEKVAEETVEEKIQRALRDRFK